MSIQNIIGTILISAIRNLFDKQPDVLTNTSLTGMTEWNYGHHLANEIAKYIFWLNHDLDVTKRNRNNKRPDIIFHKRGMNNLNFLVIEIKTSNPSEEDIEKIKKDWMSGQLQYRFGATVSVKSIDNFSVTVFWKDGSQDFSATTSVIPIPQLSEPEQKPFVELVDKILAKKERGQDTTAEENQIDQMVYKLYGLSDEEIAIIEGKNKL